MEYNYQITPMKIKGLICVLFMNITCLAQDNQFIKVEVNKRFGLYNNTGKQIFAPLYDTVEVFEDQIKISLDGCYSFINTSTSEIIKLKFEQIGNFHEGLAKVKINGKYGFINKSGELVIKPIYYSASFFSQGLAFVKFEDKWTLINKAGNELTPYIYDDIYGLSKGFYEVSISGRSGIINKDGKEILPIEYNSLLKIENGQIKFSKDNKYGSIDILTGKEVFSISCDKHIIICNEKTIIGRKRKYGVINNLGEIIVDVKYDEIKPFSENLMRVKLMNKWGVMNFENKQILEFVFDKIVPCCKQILAVGKFNDLKKDFRPELIWRIIDVSGKEISSIDYLNVGVFSEDMLRVEFGEGGVFRSVYNGSESKGQNSCRWGFIDKSGKVVISPQYRYVKDFSESYAAVQGESMKWGFVDKSGKICVPMKYDRVQNFKNGLAFVKLGKKWGAINMKGEIIIQIKYDSIDKVLEEDYEIILPYESVVY